MIAVEKEDFTSNIYQYSNYVSISSEQSNDPEFSRMFGI
jgi:hypothetical protein